MVWQKGESGNPDAQWQPGESGNPGGRPKTRPISDAYKSVLDDPDALRKLAEAMIAKAQQGDVQAAKEIADRLEGKPLQSVQVDTNLADSWAKAAAAIEERRRKK